MNVRQWMGVILLCAGVIFSDLVNDGKAASNDTDQSVIDNVQRTSGLLFVCCILTVQVGSSFVIYRHLYGLSDKIWMFIFAGPFFAACQGVWVQLSVKCIADLLAGYGAGSAFEYIDLMLFFILITNAFLLVSGISWMSYKVDVTICTPVYQSVMCVT
eukprot:UN04576